jgi:O-antigen/teichoic acid export membrane protein
MTYYSLQAFILAKKTKTLNLVILAPALVNIALNIILIPIYGLIGAAIATLLSFLLGFVVSMIWGRGFITLPLALPSLAKSSLGTLVMIGVLLILPRFGGIAEIILLGSVGVITYGAAGLLSDLLGSRKKAHALWMRLALKRSSQ